MMSQPASRGQVERLRIHRLTAAVADDFAADVRRGLTAERKFLLPKYFYDALGSLLFEQPRLTYIPVDISTAALEESASALLGDYEGLSVTAYAADYDTALPRLKDNFEDDSRALVLFLGSNVGNFDRAEARDFLRRV